MVSLQDISSIAYNSDVPVCEKMGRLCTLPINEVQGNPIICLDHYPEININCEILNTSATRMQCNTSFTSGSGTRPWRNLMVPVNEGVIKRITRTFFESGLSEAILEARNPQTKNECPPIASIAEFAFQSWTFIAKLKLKIFPHLKEQGVDSITNYVESRDWLRTPIRCIQWHPNCFKIAVAGSDDIIRIYTDDHALVPVLKSSSQKWITSMAWRPYSAAELAVGCQKGLCLWTIDSNLHITRSASQAVFLKHPNHCPITSVQWNKDGNLLATASIGDTNILIWNIDKAQNAPLRRVAPACSLLKWSPDGASLFCATVGNVFRVWCCDNKWVPERWTLKTGYIKSACWSPCSSFLLFITSEESILYRLQFAEEQLFASVSLPKQALPIADLTKFTVGHREVGGQPQQLAWDPNGNYLAITFKDSACIAIFNTAVQKFNLSISPSCFITGIGTEYPSYICFQSMTRKNRDAILTIGWSSGRIQYFPFVSM